MASIFMYHNSPFLSLSHTPILIHTYLHVRGNYSLRFNSTTYYSCKSQFIKRVHIVLLLFNDGSIVRCKRAVVTSTVSALLLRSHAMWVEVPVLELHTAGYRLRSIDQGPRYLDKSQTRTVIILNGQSQIMLLLLCGLLHLVFGFIWYVLLCENTTPCLSWYTLQASAASWIRITHGLNQFVWWKKLGVIKIKNWNSMKITWSSATHVVIFFE